MTNPRNIAPNRRANINLTVDNLEVSILVNQGIMVIQWFRPGHLKALSSRWLYATDAPGVYDNGRWDLETLNKFLNEYKPAID
jgi:hypothetical protein